MKITITNNIALNGGDAAILLGMIKALKQRFGQDTDFVVTGCHPEVCERLYPGIKWRTVIGRQADTTPFNHIRVIGRIARLFKRYKYYSAAYLRRLHIPLYKLLLKKYDANTLNEYATSDYIISSGGTYLIEPYGITAQYIDYRISLILGKPLIQYTQSMGPFTTTQTRKRLSWVFNRCQTILLRDNKSANNVLGLNLKKQSKVHIVPDAAFALGDKAQMMKRNSDTMQKYGNVAVSVREWLHASNPQVMPNYRQCIANAVIMLIDKGYKIHFISTCQGIKEYTDDNKEVDNIVSIIPDKYHSQIIKYNEHLPIPRIMQMLKEMDFIIATRLHMSILSLISGTPVYPIAYEFKTVELYKSLGYDYVDELEKLDANNIASSIIEFIQFYTPEKRSYINKQVASFTDDAADVAKFIK